jgi:hypothetical protein
MMPSQSPRACLHQAGCRRHRKTCRLGLPRSMETGPLPARRSATAAAAVTAWASADHRNTGSSVQPGCWNDSARTTAADNVQRRCTYLVVRKAGARATVREHRGCGGDRPVQQVGRGGTVDCTTAAGFRRTGQPASCSLWPCRLEAARTRTLTVCGQVAVRSRVVPDGVAAGAGIFRRVLAVNRRDVAAAKHAARVALQRAQWARTHAPVGRRAAIIEENFPYAFASPALLRTGAKGPSLSIQAALPKAGGAASDEPAAYATCPLLLSTLLGSQTWCR